MFFGGLKSERVNGKTFQTREQAKKGLFDYIKWFYNTGRRHEALGYMPPADFEKQYQRSKTLRKPSDQLSTIRLAVHLAGLHPQAFQRVQYGLVGIFPVHLSSNTELFLTCGVFHTKLLLYNWV